MTRYLTDPFYGEIALRLINAVAVGAMIGFERSYHGRPAGFRTHTLVCVSTCLLMLVTVYETRWFGESDLGRITLDPTRMAQGIMTGIGFLGAGTIMKEGLSVRGLTTAASIWMTAAIGILVGIGFYFPAVLATIITLGILSIFGWLEKRVPTCFYAHLLIRYARDAVMPEDEMRRLLTAHGFTIANLSYRLDADAGFFEYRMVIRSGSPAHAASLSATLSADASVREFRVSPVGD